MCFTKMWRLYSKVITRLTPSVCGGIFPFSMYHSGPVDVPYPEPAIVPDPNETGWKRVKRVFQTDDFGVMSDEAVVSLQASYMGCFLGICYGGINSGMNAYQTFMINNEETIFKNHFEAKKMLQDRVVIAFGKGGIRWAWRSGLLTGCVFLTANCVNVYMGRSTVLEYSIGGLVAGALYKIGDGLGGFIVGSGLGFILGTLAGVLAMSVLWISGVTMAEIKESFMKLAKSRDQLKDEAYEGAATEKEKVLSKEHENMFGTNRDLEKLNEPLVEKKKQVDKV